jgi:hypothetical protein
MSFTDRERDSESGFAHEEELRFRIAARRNKLLGLWAAGKLGLSDDEAEAYAQELVKADFQRHGDEDVFEKIRKDFDAAKVAQSDHQIRRHMSELLIEAKEQIRSA